MAAAFRGFRVSEVVSLTLGVFWRNEELVTKIGITSRAEAVTPVRSFGHEILRPRPAPH
jgi:site-specific recombinase XerD